VTFGRRHSCLFTTPEGPFSWSHDRLHRDSNLFLLFLFLIVPIGRSMNDGLTYAVNPRYDTEGRWRRRTEWPKELR